jgi:hypothetical protein
MKIIFGKFPFNWPFLIGLALLFFANLVGEVTGSRFLFYLMVIIGLALSVSCIWKNFKEFDATYLSELDKLRGNKSPGKIDKNNKD